jgi:glycosyltransferase involved in cell wall biosynthesis
MINSDKNNIVSNQEVGVTSPNNGYKELSGQAKSEVDFQPYLSVVIPAYNEEKRLPDTLNKVLSFLEAQDYPAEAIVVDDGSEDGTANIVREQISRREREVSAEIRQKTHLSLLVEPHRGKGATVQAGMLAAQGDYILFSDTDLSTPIDEVVKLLEWLNKGYDVAVGSREGLGARRVNEPFYRHLMGRVFNLLVRVSNGLDLQDTQCGFKAFTYKAAHDLFSRVQLYNANSKQIKGAMVTGFDVEVLFLAKKQGYKVKEVPVTWYHIKGSKVNPLKDTLKMIRDIVSVRWNDWRGRYR